MVIDEVVYHAFTRSCTDAYGFVQTENTWVADRQTPEQLAQLAYDEVVRQLPRPQPGFAPPPANGVVQVGTWFWADAGSWRPVSATAAIPDLSSTVTAVPVALTFDPGDGGLGSGAVTCAGPGPVWTTSIGDEAVSPCQYTYRHSSAMSPSGTWHTSMTVTWDVSFSASNGASASLGQLTTSSSTDLQVGELQAVIVGD
jgi:hypothetical protein